MANITFRKLTNNEQGNTRCDFLMENKMQCPTHASYEYQNSDGLAIRTPCAFHHNITVASDKENSYEEAV